MQLRNCSMKEGILMDNNAIMQEMIDNHLSCKIIENESETIVKLRPKAISESLNDKLSSADIELGMDAVNQQVLKFSNLRTNLYRQCSNTNCKIKCKNSFRAIPNGNINAEVLFLNKMPTEYEACNMSSHCDRNAVFLSLILSKMNVSRGSIYCTDIIKCSNCQLDEDSYNECIQTYLVKEIQYVAPKVIICNGLSVLKACIKSNVLIDLPSDITYGKIYNARTVSGESIKVIAIYDLDTVLQKTGEDYDKCKTELWKQILSAFKESV